MNQRKMLTLDEIIIITKMIPHQVNRENVEQIFKSICGLDRGILAKFSEQDNSLIVSIMTPLGTRQVKVITDLSIQHFKNLVQMTWLTSQVYPTKKYLTFTIHLPNKE